MTEHYPFFRDEDERTLAVIGEDAVVADLNGNFQKPYAVLTKCRLYTKNEQGNYITAANSILGVGIPHISSSGFWVALGLSVFLCIFSDWRISLIGVLCLGLALIFYMCKKCVPAHIFLLVFPTLFLISGIISSRHPYLIRWLYILVNVAEIAIALSVVVVALLSVKNSHKAEDTFQISHSSGSFQFKLSQYPKDEFKKFEYETRQLKVHI